jgi:hypothetical protein
LSKPLRGKGDQAVRKRAGGELLRWADGSGAILEPGLTRVISDGFSEGDDAFDAVIGLFGMVEVVMGKRQTGEPRNDKIRKLEGWILGQASGGR